MKHKRIVANRFFWPFLLFLISTVVFLPALKMKFWWVDDGYDILFAQKVLSSVVHFNFSGLNIIFAEEGGRLRIVYWFFQALTYLVGGTNPTVYFLIHYLVILISGLLIFCIVRKLSKSGFAAFVSSILFVLTPINTENLYRLGPQEPILCLFLLISLYFLLEKELYASIIFLLLTVLTKENGFVLWLPILCLYFAKRVFFNKTDKNLEKYCLWGAIFTIPIVLNVILRRGGYSGNYIFNVGQILQNFKSYAVSANEGFSPLFAILVMTYLIRLVLYFRNKKFRKSGPNLLTQGMFLIQAFLFLVIQSPWIFFLPRYLMPAMVGLVIFMGLEIAGTAEFLHIFDSRYKFLITVALVLYFFIFVVTNMIHVYTYGEKFASQTQSIQSFYSYLAKNVPTDGTILLNFPRNYSTVEFVAETEMQMGLMYHRSDVDVGYLNIDSLPKRNFVIAGTTLVPDSYPKVLIEQQVNLSKQFQSPAQENSFLVITTPISLIKQVIKKSLQLAINKRPLTSEGVISQFLSKDYWYVYRSTK